MRDIIYEYVGVIHIHTDYSDGICSIEKISKIAKSQGIDYLLFSDHMTLQPLLKGLEGWFDDKVVVIIGYEIEELSAGCNHYLAFGLSETLPSHLKAEDYVNLVKKNGGIGFIAHPYSNCFGINIKRPSWNNWRIEGICGIEIWNYMSDWLRSFGNKNVFNFLVKSIFSNRFIKGPDKLLIKRWDKMALKNKIVVIGGLDAHSYQYKIGRLKFYFLSYSKLFKTIRTHILVDRPLPKDDFSKTKALVCEALIKGRSFIANHLLGDARGFRFFIKNGIGVANIGEKIFLKEETQLNVSIPLKAKIVLLRDGDVLKEFYGTKIIFQVSVAGCYRVEVYHRSRLWILSNHIILENI